MAWGDGAGGADPPGGEAGGLPPVVLGPVVVLTVPTLLKGMVSATLGAPARPVGALFARSVCTTVVAVAGSEATCETAGPY